ncbi:Cuticle protein [Armadillidium nasatum]|uniref:Cuticle protein n=1 Tax=Armadillidium nasatum TaxID=96803 RepID=A0A5N5SZM3_9CRUS|nr:Cuticle protein [Armadillidium nasatum]
MNAILSHSFKILRKLLQKDNDSTNFYNAAAKAAAAAPDVHIYSQKSANVPQHPQPITYQSSHQFTVPQQVHTPQYHHQPQQTQYTAKWTGPLAATVPAGLPGSSPQVQNTPEVEAATADFYRSYNAALAATRSIAPKQTQYSHVNSVYSQTGSQYRTAPQPAVQQKWTGPFAAEIPAGLPGSTSQVQDTPDVLAAKSQFARAFNQQLSNVFG